MRGYFEIGIYNPKKEVNVGTLWRSAIQLGAAGIFTIGRRYKEQASDTCKAFSHIPLRHYEDWKQFDDNRPYGAQLIGIEIGGHPLNNFCHPQQTIYLLGAEDSGLPNELLANCQYVVSIESVDRIPYNVAIAGSIVMYHRLISSVKT